MGPAGPHGFRPPPLDDLERVGLTDAQRAKIDDLHDASLRRIIRIRADLAEAELDLRALVQADAPDAGRVDAAVDRVGALRTELHRAHVKEMLAVRALLTREQRAKLHRRSGAPGSQ